MFNAYGTCHVVKKVESTLPQTQVQVENHATMPAEQKHGTGDPGKVC